MGNCDLFQGGVNNPSPEFHTISTDDPVFESMGLSAFTTGEFLEALQQDKILTWWGNGDPLFDNPVEQFKFMEQNIFYHQGGNLVGGLTPEIAYWDTTSRKHAAKKISNYFCKCSKCRRYDINFEGD